MIRREFQFSENAVPPLCAGLFVCGTLLAAPATALANETAATASFPRLAAYTPTATAAFSPTLAYNPPPYTPPPYDPSAPAPGTAPAAQPPGAPTDTNWGVPPAPPAKAGTDARGDRGGADAGKADDDDDAWTLALEGYTSVPVDVGGRVTFETPFRLRLSAALGFVPGAYFGVVNNVVEASGAYDAFGAEFISARLDSGNVMRAMIGLRPVAGLYVDGGYARVALSGGLQADQFGYSIESTLHMWTLDIGYQGAIADRVVLAAGIGVMRTFSASTAVEADFDLGRTASALAITNETVAEYDRRIEEYGIVPTITARLGWDFF